MTDTQTNETLRLAGLEAQADIRIDRWGIPHIKAESEKDLFFVQGFNAARDRLWQLDLWRKRGLGLLAADFGPGYLAQDHAARHFLYRGDMAPEWVSYAPDTQAICTAFAAGINAYVSLCEAEPSRLSPEFAVFGTRPSRWEPADVVRIRSHALTRNGISEILRANIMALADAETDLLRFELDPPVSPTPEEGIVLAEIPLAATRLFKLATAPVTFDKARLAATLDDIWKWTEVTDLGDIVQAIAEEGPTTGPSTVRAPRAADQSLQAIRTGPMPCRRCVISSTSKPPASMPSARVNRPHPASRSAITNAPPSASQYSAPTRRTFMSTRPRTVIRNSIVTATAGKRSFALRRVSRSEAIQTRR